MKVRSHTDTRLELVVRPWGRVLFVAGFTGVVATSLFSYGTYHLVLGLILLPILAATFFGHLHSLRVVFDRSDQTGGPGGTVRISRWSWRHGWRSTFYGLAEIRDITLEPIPFGRGRFYYLTLVIPHGPHAGQHRLNALPDPGLAENPACQAARSWLLAQS